MKCYFCNTKYCIYWDFEFCTCGRDWRQHPPLTEKEVYREKDDEDIKPLFDNKWRIFNLMEAMVNGL